jgi:hypothetical protein
MSMAEGKPWWQMTKTPRQGFILSAVYLVIGLGEMVSGLIPSVRVWNLVIGGSFVALGVVLLAGTVVLYRRVRSDGAASAHGQPGLPPSSR